MKPSEQDRLLREILGDEGPADCRAASLQLGVAFLQRRNRRRRLLQAAATFVLPGLLMLGLVLHLASRPSISSTAGQALLWRAGTAKVKIITDDELFALFPHRAMALIGSPGQQELVFLDHGTASEEP